MAGLRAARLEFAQPGQVERLARYHGEKARWVLDAWIETWLAPAFADWCLDDDLRGVQCPTLALHGDQDEYGSVEHPQRIARLTQAMTREIEGWVRARPEQWLWMHRRWKTQPREAAVAGTDAPRAEARA